MENNENNVNKTMGELLSEKIGGDVEYYNEIFEYLDDCISKNDETQYILLCTNNKRKTKQFFSSLGIFYENMSFVKVSFNGIIEKNEANNEVLFTFIDEGLDFSDDDYDRFIECTESLNKVIIIGLYNPYGEDCEIINKLNEKRKEYKEFNFYTFDKVVEKEKDIADKTPQSKENDNEVNVLLLAMSTLSQPNERQVGRYLYKTNEIEGSSIIEGYYVSQMEPVPKMLAELLNSKKDKLDKIFVLNTNKTKDNDVKIDKLYIKEGISTSAFDYFKERCSFVHKENINDIVFDDGKKEGETINPEKALYSFYSEIKKINKKINLYVDIHGGLRDSFLIVDAILMLFKDMENIELKNIYTVEYENGESIIKDCKDRTINIFNFVNGMNEFLNYGRSKGLVEFDNKNGNQNKDLVEAINEISNGILLNRTNIFEETREKLKKSTEITTNNNYFDIVKGAIKNDYIVYVNEKKHNLLEGEEDKEDLVGELQWCLNKKHYQQALVLIESRTGEYLEEKNILVVKDKQAIPQNDTDDNKKKIINKNRKKANNLWGDWAKYSLTCQDANKFKKYQSNIEDTNYTTGGNEFFYFQKYIKYFNNIKITNYYECGKLKDGDLINYINDNNVLKNNNCNNVKKYLKIIKIINKYNNQNVQNPKDCYYLDLHDEKIEFSLSLEDIPINKSTNDEELKTIYTLLYVYKGIKRYRNDVAHAKKIINLDFDEIVLWMQFYINLLDAIVTK